MHFFSPKKFLCQNVESTENLARTIAPTAKPGDIFLLSGQIGTGKSVFARNFIQQRLKPFGASQDIPSPTYTIVQTYEAGNIEILHADLYRLKSSQEVLELSLFENYKNMISLIEWPDILEDHQPQQATRFEFHHLESSLNARLIEIFPGNDRINRFMVKIKSNAAK